ncbi:MAG: WG repeat-containing protein [Azoarcus sp.]|jgi:hypothetical protein|nr:WG repeat-containing protein [Azoarcus sp.]
MASAFSRLAAYLVSGVLLFSASAWAAASESEFPDDVIQGRNLVNNLKWGKKRCEDEIVLATKPRFDYVGNFAANGLAWVVVNGKYGYINEKGEEVITPRFDDAGSHVIVVPCKYFIDLDLISGGDDAWDFAATGLARVRVNGKYGYIPAPPGYQTPK